MNLLDLGIIVILLLVGLRGYYRGFLQEISVIVGLIVGLVFAAHYYLRLARLLAQWLHTPLYARVISFLVILVVCYWLVRIAGHFLHRFLSFVYLGSLDRVLGGAFGMVKGTVILGFILTIITMSVPKDSKLLQESVIGPYLKAVYEQTLVFLPQEFKQQVKERALKFEREWGNKKKAPDHKEET
jgi:membrane protein required for colicin V production